MKALALAIILLGFAGSAFAETPSGLPIPRFVSLKSEETNIRTGPGTRYPIQWVFKRAHLPVQIVDEFDSWRKIRSEDGSVGWVHHSMLSGKRFAMISGQEARVMRLDDQPDAKPVFKAEPGVLGALIQCTTTWCRMQISGRKAWIQKEYLWGVAPHEELD